MLPCWRNKRCYDDDDDGKQRLFTAQLVRAGSCTYIYAAHTIELELSS